MMSLSININHDNLNELPTEARERVSIATRLPGENAAAKPAELPGLEFESVGHLARWNSEVGLRRDEFIALVCSKSGLR